MLINKRNKEMLDEYSYYLESQVNRADTKRRNTVNSYILDITQYLTFLNDIVATDSKYREANEWIESLTSKDGSPIKAATRNRKISSLKGFYNYFIETKQTSFNPFNMVGIEKIKKNGEAANQITRDFLEKDEIKRLERVLENSIYTSKVKNGCRPDDVKINALRDRALFNLMICSGMRVTEICNLELDEVEINESKAIMIITVPILKDKGKRGRKIPVPIKCSKYINEYRKALRFEPSNNYVFLSQNGNRLTKQVISDLLTKYCKEAKINKHITPHSVRHSFGTHMVNNPNNSIMAVATIMGHKDAKMLQDIYYHQSEEVEDVVFSI